MNFFSEDLRRNPYPFYAALRAKSPVFEEPRTGLWLILDHQGVKRALHDHEAFSSRASPPGAPTTDWFIFMDPPRHTKLRALVSRAFTPRAIAALEPRIRALSGELLDRVRGQRELDLAASYSIPLPLLVIAEMLGAPAKDRPLFRRWSDATVALAFMLSGSPEKARVERDFGAALAEARPYVAGLVAARKAAPRDDLLTRLVEAEVDGERLTGEEIFGFFQLLLVAGHETTTNLIGNAMVAFGEHPEQLDLLRSRPDLIGSAVEEVLRYRSPVQVMFRVPRCDIEAEGQTIPAGKLTLAVIGSANHDEKVFSNPDALDIAREPNAHLSFGHGLHFCLGAPLARLEARVALPDLLSRFRSFELMEDRPWTPRAAFHVLGPEKLPLRVSQ
jgi:cytochrome P450